MKTIYYKAILAFLFFSCITKTNAQNFQQNYYDNFNMINQSILLDNNFVYIVGSVESNSGNYISMIKLDNSGSIIGQGKVYQAGWTCKAYNICKYNENFLIAGYAQEGSGDKDVLLVEIDPNLNIVNQSTSNIGTGTDDVGVKVMYDPQDATIFVLSYKVDASDVDNYRTGHISYFSDLYTHVWTHTLNASPLTYDDSDPNSINKYNFIESIVSTGVDNEYYIAGSYTQKKINNVIGSTHYPNSHAVFFAKAKFINNSSLSGLIWDKSFQVDIGPRGPSQEFAIDLLYYHSPSGSGDDRIYLLVNSTENHGYSIFEFDPAGNQTGALVGTPGGGNFDNFMALDMVFTENHDILVHGYPNHTNANFNSVAHINRSNLSVNNVYTFSTDFDFPHVSTLGANSFDQLNSFPQSNLLARVSHNSIISEGEEVFQFISHKNSSPFAFTGVEHIKIDLNNYDESEFCGLTVDPQFDSLLNLTYETVSWTKDDDLNPVEATFDFEPINLQIGDCKSETPPGTVNKKAVVQEDELVDELRVFPNPIPANTSFTIQGFYEDQERSYIISNVSGQVVLQGNLKAYENEIQIHNLSPGAYSLQISGGVDEKTLKILITD